MQHEQKSGILFVPFMTGKGGTERVIQNLFIAMKEFNGEKISLKVESIGGSENYDWTNGVPVSVLWISNFRFLRMLFYATLLPFVINVKVLKAKPDFVISTNPFMWFLAKTCVLIFRKDVKVIAWYHYSLEEKPIRGFLLHRADYYLAISSGIQKQLIDCGIDSKKIFLIYNPVKTSNSIINRPNDRIRFIYVGRIDLDGQKNVREMFSALSMISGSWTIELYGDDSNKSEINDFARTVGIKSNIKWNGFKDDVWESMPNGATALLLTSRYEGLPMVLCEAISHGIFCISSNVKTGPDDIINNRNGLLYESGNVKELTRLLQDIVDGRILPKQSEIMLTSRKFDLNEYFKNLNQLLLRLV